MLLTCLSTLLHQDYRFRLAMSSMSTVGELLQLRNLLFNKFLELLWAYPDRGRLKENLHDLNDIIR